MFKDMPEGRTHYYNDGCGEPEHNNVKILVKLDYKGKYFMLQDEDIKLDFDDLPIGEISKKEALNKEFVKYHRENCEYYGIPAYIGTDKELIKAYK